MLVAWDVKRWDLRSLWEGVPLVVLKHKRKEPEFEPQQWRKIPGMMVCAYDPNAEEVKLAWLQLAGQTT